MEVFIKIIEILLNLIFITMTLISKFRKSRTYKIATLANSTEIISIHLTLNFEKEVSKRYQTLIKLMIKLKEFFKR